MLHLAIALFASEIAMKKQLWIRLKKYRFENLVPVSFADRVAGAFGTTDAFTRAFAAKIARKHGWSDEFAFLAIREYKKFVYLGVVSRYEVTPSSVIDIVWHEHLHFTKGYREFCRDVLHQHFDHSPELIPHQEQTTVFSAQYLKTLVFYEHEFGVEPPAEIWGRPKFDPKPLGGSPKKPPRKTHEATSATSSDDLSPLYLMFASDSDTAYAPVPVDFSGGGGSMGGGGATGGWSDPAPASSDSGSHHASSCSSSSSCGSSCGGD